MEAAIFDPSFEDSPQTGSVKTRSETPVYALINHHDVVMIRVEDDAIRYLAFAYPEELSMCHLPRPRLAGITLALLVTLVWASTADRAESGGFKLAAQIKSGIFTFPRPGEELEHLPVVHLETPVRTVQEARTWLKLLQTPSVTFPKETALEDVLKSVRAALRGKEKGEPVVPIYVDPVALQECERTKKSPVAWDQEGVPLATSLRLMLKQIGMTYRVTLDGLVVISCDGDEERGGPSALILDNLSLLRAEILELRREVAALRYGSEVRRPRHNRKNSNGSPIRS